MSFVTIGYRFILANTISFVAAATTLVQIFLNVVKNPFKNPWATKLKLEPPANLSDPKYGVHKYIKVNDIKLHYVESGDASKPLMLFLHGFPEFWYSWRHQIVHFNKKYRVVAVDMRGYCDSERPEDVSSYKIEYLVEDVKLLVKALGHEKCILVSHDWGGVIACKMRETYPEILDALVMLGSTSHDDWLRQIWTTSEQRKKSGYMFLFRVPIVAELALQMNDLDIFNRSMVVKGKDTITEEDIECYKYWFRKQYALTPPLNYYRANLNYTWQDKFHTENVPFLLANGEHEKYISHDILDIMKTRFATIETTIVENCGHFLEQEEPTKINQLIDNFLVKHNL